MSLSFGSSELKKCHLPPSKLDRDSSTASSPLQVSAMAKRHPHFDGCCSNLDGAELVALCNMMMAAAGLVAKVSRISELAADQECHKMDGACGR